MYNWMEKDPKQFEFLHRLVGYASLSLIMVVYHYTYADTNYQIYLPIFLIFLLLIIPKLSRWIQYKRNHQAKRNLLFIIDIVVVATCLSAVHLNLVLTFVALFALLYTAIYIKVSFYQMLSLKIFTNITLFGKDLHLIEILL